ncbi:unnamed protein product [Coffea canephora]|uniref:Uncharacterized protein n=1 Tax=Coffea canephora TaxID=49390 RepID=A0A068V0S2_COFCA|nr:unnamed protein product [Coffea canephora]
MDTLFHGDGQSIKSANEFPQLDFDQQHSLSQGNLVNECQFDHLFNNVTGLSKLSSHLDVNSTPCEVGDDSPVEGDYFDGVFKYLQRMLMEEDDLLDKPCMLQDCLALQAAEKSFYEVLNENQPSSPSRGRPRAGQKRDSIRELVDLRDLLTRCAHAVAIYDNWTANELLKQIRQHSSPYGDPTERLAYCFANALEARLAGMGTTLYSALTTTRASAADILRAYGAYLEICPFQRMSNIFANKSIAKQTSTVTRIHIIDFGILYGFQWPCLIHGISLRPGGPPKLRITGVDLPQPGFRPAERIEETGGRLANYARRFNVPFEFNAVAKRWDTITAEDLAIDEDEMVVVNCLPRDSVMNLIKKINPEMFVHGVLNGTYGAPFFVTRFKEALYHFSSLFDMFEATLPREDQNRSMFEKEVIGREVMNVIACEGTERIERPDSYKQWQVRNQRAGFKQLPLNSEIMREIRAKVKSYYNKDFLIDADGAWMLQGWKGRVIYALSCWKPAGL